jgi:peptidoglycan/LPS O-acetylase OafA/YrhL
MIYRGTVVRDGFRNDINGLRAWAVIAVVLYHFGLPGFQGGFIGVDVFFVISGYLMTGIIVSQLEAASSTTKKFSVFDFYMARARRIVPALAVLCVILLFAGWFVLPAVQYKVLGLHVLSTMSFLSNFQFLSEAGYFDTASHEKWLLHTWSLSVEWQFYLLLPLVLALIWRFFPSRKVILISLSLGLVLSFGLAIYFVSTRPSAVFYLLPSRAWEMLAGGVVFMLPLRSSARSFAAVRLMELLGFFLILGSVFFAAPGRGWPDWWALLPVLGVVLVLLSGRNASIFTSSRLAQYLGNISYSFYLWHWPFVVALVFVDLWRDPVAICIALFFVWVMAHLSWLLIETPARKILSGISFWPSISLLLVMFILPLAFAAFIYSDNGVLGRLDPRIDQVFSVAKDVNPRRAECHLAPPAVVPECTYGGSQLGAIVVGDSHAASVIRTIERSMHDPMKHVLDWTYSGCPTLIGVERKDKVGCSNFISKIMEKQKYLEGVPVVIVNRLSYSAFGPNEAGRESEFNKPFVYFNARYDKPSPEFLADFRERLIFTACKFAENHPTYLVSPIPELRRNVPHEMGLSLILNEPKRVSISIEDYYERNRFVLDSMEAARLKCGVKILDPVPFLCSGNRCWGDLGGLPIYFDDNHLTERGAGLLEPLFRRVFY